MLLGAVGHAFERPFPRILTTLTVPMVSVDAGATPDDLLVVTARHELQRVRDGNVEPPIATSVLAAARTSDQVTTP